LPHDWQSWGDQQLLVNWAAGNDPKVFRISGDVGKHRGGGKLTKVDAGLFSGIGQQFVNVLRVARAFRSLLL